MTEAISTAQQSGSGMSNGIDTSNRANKCNGSDNYKGSEWARDGQQSLCSPDIDITTLSNMSISKTEEVLSMKLQDEHQTQSSLHHPPKLEAIPKRLWKTLTICHVFAIDRCRT
uniref:Uncharacterized protein n=1 Tax=Parascaris univalens TaxID=6257 RepID=A0A915C8W4_PARUN